MRKIFIFVMLFVSTSIFADEMITNGNFSSGITAWVKGTSEGNASVSVCSTKYYSSPTSCLLYAYGYRPFGYDNFISVAQVIKPAVSCTLSLQMQYADSGMVSDDYIEMNLTKNHKDTVIWSRGGYYTTIGQQLTWGQVQRAFTSSDTISKIRFSIYIQSPASSSYSNLSRFWIDDVSIRGTPVPGVEENENFKMKNEKLGIRNDKIYLSIADAREVELKLFDLCGRVKETIYSGVLNAGSYTFTPSIKANGIYFVKLNAGKYKTTKKLILIK